MNVRALCALAAAGLAACTSPSRAAITLQNGEQVQLDAVLSSSDHQVIVGDKLFTFIAYTSVAFPSTGLSVVGYVAQNPLSGTGFDLTGGFADVNPGDSVISEFNLRYTVEVLPAFLQQGYRITDSELLFNGAATGVGSYARVDETLLDYFAQPGTNLITTASAFALGFNPPANQLQDYHTFGPPGYAKIEVNKDVQFFAHGTGSGATASFVRQSFSQIPSPGAITLVAFAGLIVGARRRRRTP
jgi:hypothetical protein